MLNADKNAVNIASNVVRNLTLIVVETQSILLTVLHHLFLEASVASSVSSTSSSDNTYMMREIGDDFEIKKASHSRGGRIGHTT